MTMPSPPAPGSLSLTGFDLVAEAYDQTFTNSRIGRAQRDAVWRELEHTFASASRVLEINCGTGEDAEFLARLGISVVACDISPRMIEVARRRAQSARLPRSVEFRVLATEELSKLAGDAPFDGAFSNFGGLNCIADLSAVARDLARLLRPGAPVLACLLGPCCAWELIWYLAHGMPGKAFRRFRQQGTVARLGGGAPVTVRYPGVRALARAFAPDFRLYGWKGVGVAVPPSYLERWAERFPKLFDRLVRADRSLGQWPCFRGLADHVLLHFRAG